MGAINPRATLPLRLRADHTLSLIGIGEVTSTSRSFQFNGTLTVGPYDEDVELFIAASPAVGGVQFSVASIAAAATAGGGQVSASYTGTILFDRTYDMGEVNVGPSTAFTANNAGALSGTSTTIGVFADGLNVPTFSGMVEHSSSTGWANAGNTSNGVRNIIRFFRQGSTNYYSISQDLALALVPRLPPNPAAPVFLTAPALIGSTMVGVATSYVPGSVTGYPTPTITQQWTLDGADISGATSATYTPISGQETHLLRVREIASNTAGAPASSTSASGTVAAAITVPGAPTSVVGTPGNAQVSVAFSAPTSTGGAAIDLYRATVGSLTATGSTSPIVVTGLTNGTPATATVAAHNSVGYGAESAASASFTPTSPVVAHRYARFQVNSFNGGSNVTVFAITLRTADNVDRAAGLTYSNINSADYPYGQNVLTNGHTNASNWYSGGMPASATFDFTTARAIDHITVHPGGAPQTNAGNLPTSISLLVSDDNAEFTEAKRWDNITSGDWGADNSPIIRTFSVA